MQDVKPQKPSFHSMLTSYSGVLATSVSPNPTSYMFRTYDCRMPLAPKTPKWKPLKPGPASTHQIWEVARATSAAPTFFAPINLDGNMFVDGGVTANNPTQEALREVAFLYGELTGTCVVSIGSGISNDPLLPASLLSGKRTGFTHLKEIVCVLHAVVVQIELINIDVHFEASMNARFAYFRFNTINERDIGLDDWDTSGRTQTEIELSAKNFVESEETKAQMRQCASAIVARTDGSPHVYAGNVHYLVPRPPNSLFTGRTELLHHIHTCLTSSKHDLVGLLRIFVNTGMGGQGKSEICLKLAHDMREEFVTHMPLLFLGLLRLKADTGIVSGASSGLTLARPPLLKVVSSLLLKRLESMSKIFRTLSEYLQILKRDGFSS